ncbi:glycosyltransferase [Sphingobacterium sp. PCS056]|uniref:glycosyltransferase family 2 protein n=1 Tax=Sphingobacterium sp. PCS056 TaxID=2931400 RepID=UPI00200FC813|nr:glycosyltransferase [Sphingobacterium sp. PCS056]UPZ37825.1 glycosyltransferase [Sphingobacterium sp. PCS056]
MVHHSELADKITTGLVSVIVPVYNVERYLKHCVDSIVGQTYTHLEIILVDDGSPDGCGAICDYYAELDSRIQVIHKTNGGLSDARNAGIHRAKGEFIAFVDSDDLVHPQFIEILISQIGDADIAMCTYQEFEDAVEVSHISHINSVSYSGQQMNNMLYDKTYRVSPIVAWNKLYRTALWKDLSYPKGRLHEDEFIIHHIYDRVDSVIFMAINLYFYRIRGGSIMSQVSFKGVQDYYDALENRKKYFLDKGNNKLVFETNACQKNLFLYKEVTSRFHLWNTWRFSAILTEALPFKLKLHLLLKKVSISLYHYYLKSRSS